MNIPLRAYWALLVNYLRPQRAHAIALAVLLLSGIGLQLTIPQLLRYFIDTARGGGALQTLTLVALTFVGVAVTQQILTVAQTYFSENVAWTATNLLRADLALHCMRLDLSFHNARTPGEMIERIDGDVTALANFFSQFVIRVLGNTILLSGVLVLLFREDWRIGLAFCSFVAVAFFTLNRIRNIAVPHWAAARQLSAEFYGFLEERIAGTEDLRSRGAHPFAMRRFYRIVHDQMRKERAAGLYGSVMWGSMEGLFTFGYIAAFAIGSQLFAAGTMTIGTIYLVLHYTEMINRPLVQITEQLQDLQKATASIHRIQELSLTTSKIEDGAAVLAATGALPVEFRNVSFGYKADELVLKDLSFTLQPGRVLGLLGRTGSGKTTIARLAIRLYDPTSGAIYLGEQDARDLKVRDLRSRLGMVTQEVQLFQTSVRANLTFFDPEISDERIKAVLQELGLWGWYESLPRGLDTELEQGGGLSAGEAQLLAFARVFLKNPDLVILDEASSRLDPATEHLLERAVTTLMRGRTGIIIAHRLATVQHVDDIVILESGRIVEHGSRERLVADPYSRFSSLLRTGLEEVLV